jgi:hypothetical protein
MAGLVQLKVFMDIAEARIAISALEASGIPAFLFDEHLGANIFPPVSLLGVRLMVPEDRAVEAAERLGGQQQS